MIDSDDEFEMLDEIDKWRFIAFVIMELKKKEPIILDEKYLSRKGFDFKKKSLSKTLDALSPFIEVCNKMLQNITNSVTHNRIEYIKLKDIKVNNNKELPDFVPLKEWDLFLQMRKTIKKVPTDHAKDLLVEDLRKLKEQGHEPVAVLNQSIKSNWQALYAIKNTGQAKKPEMFTGLDEKDYSEGAF